MNSEITQRVFGKTETGETALLYRFPNNTNDYIEITNYGCTMKSICIHDGQGSLRNVLSGGENLETCQQSAEGLGMIRDHLSPALSQCLSHKLWQTQEIGQNHIFLTCRLSEAESGLHTALTVGARIMWVNLNRIVIDLFSAPERGALIAPECNLVFHLTDTDDYALRSFCPQILSGGQTLPVEKTVYAEMAFVPLAESAPTLLSSPEEVKPIAELASGAAGLTISAYGNMDSLSVQKLPESSAALTQAMLYGISLKSGESFAGRLIYGFDRLYSPDEINSPKPSPFDIFL